MANIIDYVNWRGDISFDERPMNEIDVMVLCHLGYADMTPAFTGLRAKRERTIKEIWDELGENVKFRLITSGRNDRRLLEQCAKSKRFGSVVISNYVDETSVIANMQFAALTYHVSDKEVVVVFRGTDDTIVGWKEDFMISYTKVPAQEKAYSYLKRTLARNEKCHVAGHSKGANLALFAVAHLEKEELDKVAKVYLNDGPGFCNEVLDTESKRNPDEDMVVVIARKGDQQVGLVIDELMGQQEIVIKPLGKYTNKCKLISGATILGDGEIALILDTNSIF